MQHSSTLFLSCCGDTVGSCSSFFYFMSLFSIKNYLENRTANPKQYAVQKSLSTTVAGKTMIWTGLVIGIFLIYHLLHFTVQVTHPEISAKMNMDSLGRPDVFTMVVLSFQNIFIAVVYVIAMIALALHLTHGIQSSFQTLGLNNDRAQPVYDKGGIPCSLYSLYRVCIYPDCYRNGITDRLGDRMILDAKCPSGPLSQKWDRHRQELKLVNPANKRKYKIIVVGTGLAGASAAATLGELGYNVEAFCYQDSPRRGHSIAAQGGINAAKNYPNDGDSIFRLFYDTVKGWRFQGTGGKCLPSCHAQ